MIIILEYIAGATLYSLVRAKKKINER